MSRAPTLPQIRENINEGSAIKLELTHLDEDKVLAVPTTLQYRVDDITNIRQVLDWTTVVAPGSTNTITVTGAQNAVFSRLKDRQNMQITTRTVSSTGDVTQEDFYYTIIRIFTQEDQLI